MGRRSMGCSLAVVCFLAVILPARGMQNLEDEVPNTTQVTSQPTTDAPFTLTPGHSIRLEGKGVGTWKEISLSGPRGNNARYTDPPQTSSGTKTYISNVGITTLLAAWISFS